MSQSPADHLDSSASKERLSALMDGEADAAAAARACGSWRDDASLRSSWHAYHLIGDVLRSEDLTSCADRDAGFLQAVRFRLASEPTVLAPDAVHGEAQPVVAGDRKVGVSAAGKVRSRWKWAGASAAGFVAIVGVATYSPRSVEIATSQPVPASTRIVSMDQASGDRTIGGSVAAARPALNVEASYVEPQPLVASGKLIRDARLDRYLAAHQQFAGTTALGVPSSFLRSATADASNR